MIQELFVWWFKLKGWKIGNAVPSEIKKCVVIAAPHTSNWDFVYALASFKLFNLSVNYLAKKELFWWPLSILLKNTGGIPIERSKKNNAVNEFKKLFAEREKLILIFPAEGTRKAVEKWKTGFYHVAVDANVPVLLGYLDYEKKIASFGEPYFCTGNPEQDFNYFKTFYKDIAPKNKKGFNIEGVKYFQKKEK